MSSAGAKLNRTHGFVRDILLAVDHATRGLRYCVQDEVMDVLLISHKWPYIILRSIGPFG